MLGLPEYLTNSIFGQGSWNKDIQRHNSPTGLYGLTPEQIGGGSGTIGSMFIPGGAITKGIGGAAKVLGAGEAGAKMTELSKFLAGAGKTNLGTNVLRGAGQAAEQAIPRAVIGGANAVEEGADPGQATGEGLKDVALSSALGGGIGGALGASSKLVKGIFGDPATGQGGMVPENLAQKLKESSADQAVSGTLGTTTRAVRQYINEGPNWEKGSIGKANSAEQAMQDQANSIAEHKIGNLSDLDDLHDQVKQFYNNTANTLNETNTPLPAIGSTKFQDWIKSDPNWASFSRLHPNADEALDEYANKLASPDQAGSIYSNPQNDPNPNFAKNLFNATSQDANQLRFGQPSDVQTSSMIADLAHSKLEDLAMKHAVSGDNPVQFPPGMHSIEDVNKFYHDNAIYRATKRIEATTMNPAAVPGSQTGMSLAMQALVGGAIGSQGDASNIPGMVGGAIVGGMANRGLSSLINKIGGRAGLRMNQALGGGGSVGANATPLGQRIEAIRNFARGGAMPDPGAPPDMSTPLNISAIPGAAMGGQVASAAAPPNIPPQQQPMQQGQQPQAQQMLSQMGQYGKIVQARINQLYDQLDRTNGGFLSQSGIDQNAFANEVMSSSNGFDPEIMANLIFPDEGQRKNFVTSYKTVQQLRGLNVDSVLQTNPMAAALGASILNPSYAATRGQLAMILAQNNTGADVKQAIKQLDDIQWSPGPIAQKRVWLARLIQNSAKIDSSQVHQLGLDQGTILEALPQ
jgi:hypothetical protein